MSDEATLPPEITTKRTLATIVFTDVASFSAQMNEDEVGTLNRVNRDFTMMREICEKKGGRVLKSMGDGLLMYFDSASQAVSCAMEIQNTNHDRARKEPNEKRLLHRIGIHIGDVYFNQSDVMGDGVNIASRLESKAEPGGICISQTVYDVVKNSIKLDTTYLGPIELKNIREKVPVYQLLLEAHLGEDGVKKRRGSVPKKKKQKNLALVLAGAVAIAAVAAFVIYPMLIKKEPVREERAAAGATTEPAAPTADSARVAQEQDETASQLAAVLDQFETALKQQEEAVAKAEEETAKVTEESEAAIVAAVEAAKITALEATAPALDMKRVYVAIFENLTGDPAEQKLGNVICDSISQGLEGTKLVAVIPATINRVAADLILDQGVDGGASGSIIGQAEQNGAGIAIYGSYFWQTYDLKIQTKIILVETGEVLNSMDPVSGPLMSPRKVVGELQERVASAMSLYYSTYRYLAEEMKSWPPLYSAYKLYDEGMKSFGHGDYQEAFDNFNEAQKKDPQFMTPTVMKAAAMSNLDKIQQANGLFENLRKKGTQLNELDQLYVDFALASNNGDVLNSYRFARELVDLESSHRTLVNAGLRALWLNRPNEALEIFQKTDPELRMTPLDAYTYHFHAVAQRQLGHYEEALKVAEEGVKEFPYNFIALRAETLALAELGQLNEVNRRISSSYRFTPLGELTTGRLLLDTGMVLAAKGNDSAAAELYDQAFNWVDKLPGKMVETDQHRFFYGELLYRAGKYDEAKKIFSTLAGEYSEYPVPIGYVGLCAARLAETREALEIFNDMRTANYPESYGWDSYMRARIAALIDDKEQAASLLQDAFTQNFPNVVSWTIDDLRHESDFASVRDTDAYVSIVQPKG